MSQCSQILALLKDGKPRRMEEIHQHAGFCRLNSRVSELRRRGHDITCDKTGGVYTYQLHPPVEGAEEPHVGRTSGGGLGLAADDVQRSASPSASAPSTGEQLKLVA
jgi:hypothetical protein